MAQRFEHDPVMVGEVVALFGPVPPGVVVDGTVGGGGHAAALLAAHPHLALLGLDRDPEALAAASARLAPYGDRAVLRHARFGDLASEVDAAREAGGPAWPSPGTGTSGAPGTGMASGTGTSGTGTSGAPGAAAGPAGAAAAAGAPGSAVVGVLLDLGVSSPQLDRPERGFSYRQEGPLDMRMDPTGGRRALDLVNEADPAELAAAFAASGEPPRLAWRIARAVVAARPVTTTTELADVVARAVPAARRRRGHPARRVFQALRMAVNDELDELAAALPAALDVVATGGRVVVVAYHSGEDRLVKAAFAEAATGGCTCPPGLPCACGARPQHRLVFRGARRPSAAEVERNHRAESARLRACERVADRP